MASPAKSLLWRYLFLLALIAMSGACGDSGGAEADGGPDSVDGAVNQPLCSGFSAATAGVSTRSIMVAGVQRSYELSIPNDYDPTARARLVFGWHGLGGDGALLRSYTDVEGESRSQPSGAASIFVYPDGLVVEELSQTGWLFTDADFFDAMVTALSSELCIDSSRIFSYGHSFGGYFSNSLGCLRGEAVRAIAPVAGGWPAGMGACGPAVPAWLAHATDDNVVAVGLGQAARDEWLAKNQCSASSAAASPSPCVEYADCQSGASVFWCQASSGGHAWPGFANDGIWQFFASFSSL
jgi:poly(3-hydroxybutyrate) depolymerase